MKPESGTDYSRWDLLRNWWSIIGLVIAVLGIFAFLLLFIYDSMARFSNPYVGVALYFFAFPFAVFGLFITGVGAIIEHRRMAAAKQREPAKPVPATLSRLRSRHIQEILFTVVVILLGVTAVGSYHTYHFVESPQFCGATCHVMEPENTTYQHSPHAHVGCTECHVGPGVTWFMKAKINGMHQLVAMVRNTYSRPIPPPAKHMRPARETCEQCHWSKKFYGNMEKVYEHYLADEKNTHYAVRLSLKVGGSDPTHGPVGGIHWHMNVANKIEFVATDKEQQVIPWIRMTDAKGVQTEFRAAGYKDTPNPADIQTMDCMDCHNRPAHNFAAPDTAVDLAMSLGKIDRSLPSIGKHAVALLTGKYASKKEALDKIAAGLKQQYPNEPRIQPAIAAVQEIYSRNFFPAMKASWKAYPDNIGHKDWAGCFRCHDGQHATADGKQKVKASDCNACHLILAQGTGAELNQLNAAGHAFKHPGGDLDPSTKCNECHSGGAAP
ncbi:MAG: NapC/NirT family cytochrome c [Verrucomicrobia bacterium]|nr:NapC/NirT family cytochrome c [Verrucomicrobiota bacterium]